MLRLLLLGFLVFCVWMAVRQFRARAEVPDDAELPEPPADLAPATLSAWLHARLTESYAYEREPWALQRVQRVTRRLQAGMPAEARRRVTILWIPEVTAFTFPGPHIYLSRRLLERVSTDAPVAFVIAHEMAHHALGHMRTAERWMEATHSFPAASALSVLLLDGARWMNSADNERAADAWALRTCADAGYDLDECIGLLDVLEADALDAHAFGRVYGPEPSAAEVEGEAGLADLFRRWRWERTTGYPTLLDRRAALRELARELQPATA